jgi:hypothetical protein
VAGTWRANSGLLTVTPFRPLAAAAVTELQSFGEELARFLVTPGDAVGVRLAEPSTDGPKGRPTVGPAVARDSAPGFSRGRSHELSGQPRGDLLTAAQVLLRDNPGLTVPAPTRPGGRSWRYGAH